MLLYTHQRSFGHVHTTSTKKRWQHRELHSVIRGAHAKKCFSTHKPFKLLIERNVDRVECTYSDCRFELELSSWQTLAVQSPSCTADSCRVRSWSNPPCNMNSQIEGRSSYVRWKRAWCPLYRLQLGTPACSLQSRRWCFPMRVHGCLSALRNTIFHRRRTYKFTHGHKCLASCLVYIAKKDNLLHQTFCSSGMVQCFAPAKGFKFMWHHSRNIFSRELVEISPNVIGNQRFECSEQKLWHDTTNTSNSSTHSAWKPHEVLIISV